MAFLTIEPSRERIFEDLSERAEDVRPALMAAIKAWRSVGREEFDREAWNSASGGFRPWIPTKPFGNTPPPPKTLQRTGALLRAYLGMGPGAIEQVGRDEARFGVSGAVLPYAVVHRGGGVGRLLLAGAETVERIPVTDRMRRFLAAAKGVYLRKETRFIEIPRRSHFTLNPEVRTRIAAIFAAHHSGREIPGELVA